MGSIARIQPSYHQGFAPRDGAPLYPNLHRGLVGAWSPNLGNTGGTLYDRSGFGNDGTLTNMDPATDWVLDDGALALDLDGSNDYANCGSIAGIRSVSIWINMNILDGNPRRFFDWRATNGFTIFQQNTGEIHLRYNGLSDLVDSTVAAGEWNHWVASHDGANVSLYKNGAFVGSAAVAINDTAGDFVVGVRGAKDSQFLKGMFDDAFIYNRALNPNEIHQLYTLGRGGIFQLGPRFVGRSGAAGGPSTISASITEGAKSGDTEVEILTVLTSISEGAKSGDTEGEVLIALAAVLDGAVSGDTNSLISIFQGVISEGALSGDTEDEILTALASLSEGAKSGATYSLASTSQGGVSEGAKSGDTNIEVLTALASISEGARSGDTESEVLIALGAVSEGAISGDTNSLASSIQVNTSEGALSGDTNIEVLTALASVSEGAKSGDTNSVLATLVVTVTEGAVSSDVEAVVATLLVVIADGAVSGDTNSLGAGVTFVGLGTTTIIAPIVSSPQINNSGVSEPTIVVGIASSPILKTGRQ